MAVSRLKTIDVVPDDLEGVVEDVGDLVREFAEACEPLEAKHLYVLVDARTNARYCECHIRANKIISLGTIDVPLDPDEQPDYRANREIVEDHVAYEKMKEDASSRRTFSNIVAEFTSAFNAEQPLKIIGGQHRFNAIKQALGDGINEYHGLKVYFGLDADQRLDVQLISNTNIAVSTDLFDRMHETLSGPRLRNWCQEVSLLDRGQDFADKRQRGQQITVRAARTFIVNYYKGRAIKPDKFDVTSTTPIICKTGVPDLDWEDVKVKHPQYWKDAELKKAGQEFALLAQSQRDSFASENSKRKGPTSVDYAEKALNFAVLSAWAYVAGILQSNNTRLARHYALRNQSNRDPLNAAVLAKGRHKTDPDNYRGLGYRVDPKERGRFVELFYLQAEKGEGINKKMVDIAIARYHAKQATLEMREAEGRA